jgi:hypothetical protein
MNGVSWRLFYFQKYRDWMICNGRDFFTIVDKLPRMMILDCVPLKIETIPHMNADVLRCEITNSPLTSQNICWEWIYKDGLKTFLIKQLCHLFWCLSFLRNSNDFVNWGSWSDSISSSNTIILNDCQMWIEIWYVWKLLFMILKFSSHSF